MESQDKNTDAEVVYEEIDIDMQLPCGRRKIFNDMRDEINKLREENATLKEDKEKLLARIHRSDV